jgi:hypothetical protein
MSVTAANKEAIPDDVTAVLDPHLSHELLKKITGSASAHYIVLKSSKNEGSVVVIRQTPGSVLEAVSADISDSNTLPREVAAEPDAIFEEPATKVAEAPHALETSAAIAAAATPEQVCKRLLDKAQAPSGHFSSRSGPGSGRLGCVWALSQVTRQALGGSVADFPILPGHG